LNSGRYNTDKADWPNFANSLKTANFAKILNSIELSNSANTELSNSEELGLDELAQELTDNITLAARAYIPIYKPGAHAKPWWSLELKALRRKMIKDQRDIDYISPASKSAYLKSRA